MDPPRSRVSCLRSREDVAGALAARADVAGGARRRALLALLLLPLEPPQALMPSARAMPRV